MTKFRFILALFISVLAVSALVSSSSQTTLAGPVGSDNWVAASSVGMGNNNYAAFTVYKPTADSVCFGGWAHSQTDSVLGCQTETSTFSATMFDSSTKLKTERHVAELRAFPNIEGDTRTITANAYFDPQARPGGSHQNRLYRTGYMTQAGFTLDPTAFYEDFSPPNVWNVKKINSLIWFNNNLYAGMWSPSTRGGSNNIVEASQGLDIWKHPGFDQNDPYWKNGDTNYLPTIQNQWQKVVNAGSGSTQNEGVMHMFIHNNALYASVFNHGDNPKFLKTTDGTNWSWVDTNIPGANNYVVSNVTYQGKLVVGLANGGVYSADNANLTNWTSLGAPGGIGHALTVDNSGTRLYAGGRFNGSIYKSVEGAGFELSKNLGSSFGVYSLAITGNRIWAGTGNLPFWRGENAPNFYYSNPRSARVWCLGCADPPPPVPTLEIELPPTGLVKLQSFKFGGYVCDMSLDTFNPSACANNGKGYVFSRDKIESDDPGETLDDRYVIRVTNFAKGDGISMHKPNKTLAWLKSQTTTNAMAPPPATNLCVIVPSVCSINSAIPYGYQVTFAGTAVTNVSTYRTYLATTALSNAYLGTDSCVATNTNPTRLCLKSNIKLSVPENLQNPALATLIESVAIGGSGAIQFEGNVGGAGTLSGFGFTDTKAIAVGGNANNVQGSNVKLSGYLATATQLKWANISTQLTAMFDKRTDGTEYAPQVYAPTTWNLNSSSGNPNVTAVSSFSSPPEGKLWYTPGSNNLTFNSPVTFTGRGTIAVNGNVVFNGDVSCSSGEVGIIATGSITFRGNVNCGAYTALGGSINMTKAVGAGTTNWEGIFIARDNIDLPTVTGALIINYATEFANNPTVLFKELLGIVFGTDS